MYPRSSVRRPSAFAAFLSIVAFAATMAATRAARADDEDEAESGKPTPTTVPAAPPAMAAGAATGAASEPPDAPPARPWSKGLVVEGSLGALTFLGAFRRLAPPAFQQRVQVGFELFSWLMPFVGGEVAFTDTSVGQDQSKVRAFPLWSFDAGARLTVRPTPRVGLFAQGSVGMMKADVPANGLAVVGFPDAESLRPTLGGRVGVEWYQIDRHLAFGLTGGPRLATGFERSYGKGDTPLMIDGAVTLRYTF